MPEPARTLLVFELAGRACALPVETVQEIVPMAELAHPPGLPCVLEGFLNLRGGAVPVLRLNRLFDLPARPPGLHTPLIILPTRPCALALLAEAVTGIVTVPSGSILPIRDKNCFNDCVEAEMEIHERLVHLLSPERLLLEKERQCVAELQAKAQQYLDELEAQPA